MSISPRNHRLLALFVLGFVAGCQPAQRPPPAQAAASADTAAQTALDTSTAKASEFDTQERLVRRQPGAFAAAAAAARPPSARFVARDRLPKAAAPVSDAASAAHQSPP